jgi:antitoxin (DNA-binding transcriptional repressor) of toxin-antitoxin stability system
MAQVDVYDAKTHGSELIERAAQGEEVLIARAGVPRARLGALAPAAIVRRPGRGRGKIELGPDFEAPRPREEAAAFGRDGPRDASTEPKP